VGGASVPGDLAMEHGKHDAEMQGMMPKMPKKPPKKAQKLMAAMMAEKPKK